MVVSTNLELNQNILEISREVRKSLTKLVAWFYCLKGSINKVLEAKNHQYFSDILCPFLEILRKMCDMTFES